MTTFSEIETYHLIFSREEIEICNFLANAINSSLAYTENKIWHAHPVWFIDKNPIVGYSKEKKGIRLIF